MDENIKQENTGTPWWRPAVQVFMQVSTWIALPILVALFAGKSLDRHFGTAPVIFLVLIAASFIFSCIGIVRVIKNYTKKLKDIENPTSHKATKGEEKY